MYTIPAAGEEDLLASRGLMSFELSQYATYQFHNGVIFVFY